MRSWFSGSLVALLCSASPLAAASPAAKASPPAALCPAAKASPPTLSAFVKVCSPSVLLLGRTAGYLWTSTNVEATLFREEDSGARTLLDAHPKVSPLDPNRPTTLTLSLDVTLEKNRSYVLSIRDGEGSQFAVVQFSTSPEAAILPEVAKVPRQFFVSSTVRFAEIEDPRKVTFEAVPTSGQASSLGAAVSLKAKGDCLGQEVTSDNVGDAAIKLLTGEDLPRGTAAVRLTGLTDIFGQPVKAAGQLKKSDAPKGKDDAQYYAKIDFESERDQKSSLALDLKLAPNPIRTGIFLFHPEFDAAVSKNVPQSENSMTLSGLFSYATEGALRSYWHAGPTLEADRNLDRVNAVADLQWAPKIDGMDHSRTTQQITEAIKCHMKIEDVPLPRFGYSGDLSLGVEAGGSIKEQTVVNQAKTQKLPIDSYGIMRLRPKAHGNIEAYPFSLDVSFTGRYLGTTELAGRERPDGSLELRRIHGIQTLTVTTLGYAFDPDGHSVLTVTYKNGAAPPLFEDINTYSIGLVIKY